MKELLQQLNIPFAYSHFQKPVTPPYIVYLGNGQDNFASDNTWYHSQNRYQLEYYFILKDESKERAIEETLIANGYNYTKSEDLYLEEEGVFLIYYYI